MTHAKPPSSLNKANDRQWLFFAALVVVVLFAGWWLLENEGAYDIDDAPITYRYAENIAAGNGYVYNLGERIQGTSTPLYTLLLAGLRVLGSPVPASSHFLNLLASLGIVLIVFLTTKRIGGSLPGAISAVCYLLLTSPFLRYSMTGMETPFYTALIVGAFYALTFDAGKIAAVLAALAFVTRLDGAAVAVGVFAFLLISRRRIPWVEGAIFGCVALPWYLFATWYFGTPLPHSMLAKQDHMVARGTTRYWIYDSLIGAHAIIPSLPFAFVLIGIGDLLAVKRYRAWLVAPLVWFATYAVAYILVGIDFYEWYLYPVLTVAAIFIGCAVGAILRLLMRNFSLDAPVGTRMRWVNGLLAALFLFLAGSSLWYQLRPAREWWADYLVGVEGSRVAAGEWLFANAPEDKSVFTGFIGHVGYQSGHYIYDGASLVSVDGPSHIPDSDYAVLAGDTLGGRDCGPVAEFSVAPSDFRAPTVIGLCHGERLAQVGELDLMNVRMASEVIEGVYHDSSHGSLVTGEPLVLPLIELQWNIDRPSLLKGDWQVFVHLTDAEGKTLTQADHPLGRQVDGMIWPPGRWDPSRRIYTYTELPENYAEVADRAVNLRMGVWNPATGEHLPLDANDGATVDEANRLVLPMPSFPWTSLTRDSWATSSAVYTIRFVDYVARGDRIHEQ